MMPPRGMQTIPARAAEESEIKMDLKVISTTWGSLAAISSRARNRPL